MSAAEQPEVMPNYPTHARWGRLGAVLTAIVVGVTLFVLFESPFLAAGGAVGAAAATFVGAIFPDVDHHRSVPRRKASRAIRALVVLGVASLAALNFELFVSAAESLASGPLAEWDLQPELLVATGTVLAAFVAAWLVDPAIGVATRRHRGWTHSVPVMFVLTAALVALVVVLTGGLVTDRQLAAALVVSTFFLGCLIHLGLDGELW